jgi:hypothetical protein
MVQLITFSNNVFLNNNFVPSIKSTKRIQLLTTSTPNPDTLLLSSEEAVVGSYHSGRGH